MATKKAISGVNYIVISSDMHGGAGVYDYKPYLPTKWHEDFEAWAKNFHDPWEDVEPGDHTIKAGVASGAVSVNWDSDKRMADLNADGISGEIIFPNTAPPFYPTGVLTARAPANQEEYERRWAGLQAHNRWLIDFCADYPERRAGIGQILVNDIDDAVNEIKFFAENNLRGGALLPMIDAGSHLDPLYDPKYEPIWQACAEYDVTLNQHATATGPTNTGTGPAYAITTMIEASFWPRRLLWQLMFAGIFDRHPSLRVVLTESQVGWVPAQLDTLDGTWEAGRSANWGIGIFAAEAVKGMKLSPTEYFHRNFYLGASFMMPVERSVIDVIGDRLMWGADYPHSEGTFPYSTKALQAAFHGLPADKVERMVGGTAAEVYNFDLDALAPIAAQIGPSVDLVAQPLTEAPRVPEDSKCPAFIGEFKGY